jgi:hypothetical protein
MPAKGYRFAETKTRQNNVLIRGPHTAALQPEENVTDNFFSE